MGLQKWYSHVKAFVQKSGVLQSASPEHVLGAASLDTSAFEKLSFKKAESRPPPPPPASTQVLASEVDASVSPPSVVACPPAHPTKGVITMIQPMAKRRRRIPFMEPSWYEERPHYL